MKHCTMKLRYVDICNIPLDLAQFDSIAIDITKFIQPTNLFRFIRTFFQYIATPATKMF